MNEWSESENLDPGIRRGDENGVAVYSGNSKQATGRWEPRHSGAGRNPGWFFFIAPFR
jgi:hypothetical protein